MQRGRMFLWVILGVGFLIGLFPSPVWAEGPEIFTPVRIDLGVWTLIVFLGLLFILRKYAWQPMIQGLQQREQSIHEALAEAQRAREEAQRLRGELQAERDQAEQKVRDLMDEARRDAQRLTDEMSNKAKAEIQAERERLRREIKTARDQALQDIWNQAGQLATVISSKVIRRELNTDDHRRLVDEALTELRQANVGWKDRVLY
jgi:F-type H+-transporting ATPase subunit b